MTGELPRQALVGFRHRKLMKNENTSLRQKANQLLHRLDLHLTSQPDPGRIPWILKNLDNAPSPLRWMVPELIRQHDLKTFVQVGANDGEWDDPLSECINKFPIRGIMVEPQPGACAKLKRKYAGNDRVTIEQAAISQNEGFLTLYHLSDDQISVGGEKPLRSDLLTSGNRAHMEKMRTALGQTCGIEELQVPALTWPSLLRKHGIPNPDMVLVDTEGMDDVIVNQIEHGEHSPAFIQFESLHLDSARLTVCTRRLAEAGYRFVMSEYDLLCLHGRLLKGMM
jgi:FkbM family methyltransferase